MARVTGRTAADPGRGQAPDLPLSPCPEAESKAETGVGDPPVQHSGRSWRGAELVGGRGSAPP